MSMDATSMATMSAAIFAEPAACATELAANAARSATNIRRAMNCMSVGYSSFCPIASAAHGRSVLKPDRIMASRPSDLLDIPRLASRWSITIAVNRWGFPSLEGQERQEAILIAFGKGRRIRHRLGLLSCENTSVDRFACAGFATRHGFQPG